MIKKSICCIAATLTFLGAINVGLWGSFQFDLIAWAFHSNTNWGSRFCYALVGYSAIFWLYQLLKSAIVSKRIVKELLKKN